MKSTLMKSLSVVLVVITMSSCYGPFRLTCKLHQWNGEISNKKFVNELVFLGLSILPAYELCALGDVLIFNSIEFWGGKNPIAMNEGEVEEMEMMHKGQMYKVTTSKNSMTVALKDSDEKVDFKYFPEEGQWYQMNGEEKGLAVR